MSAITPEYRAAKMAADVLDMLSDNVQTYRDVAQRTRMYRLYVFCRRHEEERRAFHSALAWLVTGEEGVKPRRSWAHRLHRFFAHFRIERANRLGTLILELRQDDAALRHAVEGLLAQPGLDGATWMVVSKLVSAIRATEAEFASIAGHRRDTRTLSDPAFI